MRNRIRNSIHWLSLAFLAAMVSVSAAAIDYSSIGSTYTQNFDALASSGTDIPWSNDSTIPGWSLFRVTSDTNHAPVPLSFYDASDGSASDGRFYSLGNNADRALGGVGSGKFGDRTTEAFPIQFSHVDGWITASIANNTGIQLTRFTLRYDGEQWSDADLNPQTLAFQYGLGATFADVATWSAPGGSFDFVSPVHSQPGNVVDGNGAGRLASLGGTVTNVAWQPGSTLWFRWIELNDAGGDHALAIDNISFSANSEVAAVPEAPAVLFGGLVCSISGLAVISRRMLAWLYSKNSNTVAN